MVPRHPICCFWLKYGRVKIQGRPEIGGVSGARTLRTGLLALLLGTRSYKRGLLASLRTERSDRASGIEAREIEADVGWRWVPRVSATSVGSVLQLVCVADPLINVPGSFLNHPQVTMRDPCKMLGHIYIYIIYIYLGPLLLRSSLCSARKHSLWFGRLPPGRAAWPCLCALDVRLAARGVGHWNQARGFQWLLWRAGSCGSALFGPIAMTNGLFKVMYIVYSVCIYIYLNQFWFISNSVLIQYTNLDLKWLIQIHFI